MKKKKRKVKRVKKNRNKAITLPEHSEEPITENHHQHFAALQRMETRRTRIVLFRPVFIKKAAEENLEEVI